MRRDALQLFQLLAFVLLSTFGICSSTAAAASAPITISASPNRPFIETRDDQFLVNVDLLARNTANVAYRLVTLRLSVYDRAGKLELVREVNENGRPPAIDLVGTRRLASGDVVDIYQPFFSFSRDVDLHRMHFELLFMKAERPSPPVAFFADLRVKIDVLPRRYAPVRYCLPFHGLTLVYDGHDFYSHHRRYNLASRYRQDPKSALATNLYAYDFVRATTDGTGFRGTPRAKTHWLTYGEPVYAPAAGTVIEAVSDVSDNTFDATGAAQSPPGTAAIDPLGLGNYMKILHSDGRVSWLLHLRRGSLHVRIGEHVQAGQLLANIGFSGDALFPHLHYTVTDGPNYPSQGVPSYFKQFTRVLGARRKREMSGQVDTGDFVVGDPHCR